MIFCHSQKLEIFGIGYTLCVPKIIINTETCFAFDCPIQIELLCLTQDNNEEKQLPLGTGLLQKFEAGTGID